MSVPIWVLDTGALLAYVHGVETVGRVLVDVADTDECVAVPLTCMIEAYSILDADQFDPLTVLRGLPTVQISIPSTDPDDFPFIGGLARRAQRLSAGHAAYLAMVSAAGVITSRADQIRFAVGVDWPLLEV